LRLIESVEFFSHNKIKGFTHVNAKNLLSWLSQLSSCHVTSLCTKKFSI